MGESCPVVVVVRRAGLLGVVSSSEEEGFVGAEKGERCSVIRGDGERDLGAFLEYSWPWRPAPGCRRFIASFFGVWFVYVSWGGALEYGLPLPAGWVCFVFEVWWIGWFAPSLRGYPSRFDAREGWKEGRDGFEGETLRLRMSRSEAQQTGIGLYNNEEGRAWPCHRARDIARST